MSNLFFFAKEQSKVNSRCSFYKRQWKFSELIVEANK